MPIYTIALFVLGGLLTLVGGIMGLVAAFRTSLVWGLATLFLPFANLVFLVMHWAEARKGFFVSIAGCALFGLGLVSSPVLREGFANVRAFDASKMQLPAVGIALEKAKAAPSKEELTAMIQTLRGRIEQGEAQFATDGNALVQQFQKLTAERVKLKGADAATVTAFNAQAADYQSRNTARQNAKAELDALRAELETLLAQRSRQNAAAAAPAGGKKVVMYSTANCGACKMAKAYFAQKGVKYEERDVNNSPEARAEFEKLGGRGVPLILVGKEQMTGFSSQRLDQLL